MAFIDRFAMSIGSRGANGLVSPYTRARLVLSRAHGTTEQPAVEEDGARAKNAFAHALPVLTCAAACHRIAYVARNTRGAPHTHSHTRTCARERANVEPISLALRGDTHTVALKNNK